ncbi:MAG: hypothetical protein ACOVRN_10400 [Flavobacterium sp.]
MGQCQCLSYNHQSAVIPEDPVAAQRRERMEVLQRYYMILQHNLEQIFTTPVITLKDAKTPSHYLPFNLDFNPEYSHQFRTISDLLIVFISYKYRCEYKLLGDYIAFHKGQLYLYKYSSHDTYYKTSLYISHDDINNAGSNPSTVMLYLIIILCHLELDLFSKVPYKMKTVRFDLHPGQYHYVAEETAIYSWDDIFEVCKQTSIPIEFLLRLQTTMSNIIPICDAQHSNVKNDIQSNTDELARLTTCIQLYESRKQECLKQINHLTNIINTDAVDNNLIIDYRILNDSYTMFNNKITNDTNLFNQINTVLQQKINNYRQTISMQDIYKFKRLIDTTVILNIPLTEPHLENESDDEKECNYPIATAVNSRLPTNTHVEDVTVRIYN